MSKAAALRRNLSAEALLLAAVLGWTTALGNTPPGTPSVVATTSPVNPPRSLRSVGVFIAVQPLRGLVASLRGSRRCTVDRHSRGSD